MINLITILITIIINNLTNELKLPIYKTKGTKC